MAYVAVTVATRAVLRPAKSAIGTVVRSLPFGQIWAREGPIWAGWACAVVVLAWVIPIVAAGRWPSHGAAVHLRRCIVGKGSVRMVLTWRTPGRVEVGAAAPDSTAATYACCSGLLALGIRRRHDLHGAAACGEALRLLASWKPGQRPRVREGQLWPPAGMVWLSRQEVTRPLRHALGSVVDG
jgi:hypothetical protein